ncbi:methyltransferase domain-containing protein [Dactylosporangium sp. NPDC051485]|uniref:class I SAM-dependent methyltransferase n=1 Tax=Dactylosporangium sp. NPDC051485 TaxID=3154846 RepID=UPI00342C9ED2
MPEPAYLFDNTTPQAKVQLPLLAELLDGHTTSVLSALAEPGQTWLDLGAGACTVSKWLVEQVGPTGSVTAIDRQPLPPTPIRNNLTIHRGELKEVHIAPGSVHGVHARLVLMHAPDRLDLLHMFVDALAPGGWFVVSDWTIWDRMIVDSPSDDATELLHRFQTHLLQLGADIGMDINWAADANQAMREAGLVDVQTTSFARTWTGGTGICRLHDSNSRQKENELIGAGFGRQDLEALREVLADPRLTLSDYLLHTTVGRKPLSGDDRPQPAGTARAERDQSQPAIRGRTQMPVNRG